MRVILLDASDRARIEFEKVYNMDGKHEQRTRAYLVVDGAGKVITESDEVSDNNLLKSGGGEKDCRVGAPW